MLVQVTWNRWWDVKIEYDEFGQALPSAEPRPDDVVRTYNVDDAAEALEMFCAVIFDGDKAAMRKASIDARTPNPEPRPERRLMNWERDPMNEVSDGYLSNWAAQANNLRDELAHTPQYCTAVLSYHACPECGTRMNEYENSFRAPNGFSGTRVVLHCPACRTRFGRYTKRADKAEKFTTFCGGRLVQKFNQMGVAYSGCECAHADPGYGHLPIGQLLGLRGVQ